MKKFLLSALAITSLTGCGTVKIENNNVIPIPSNQVKVEEAKKFDLTKDVEVKKEIEAEPATSQDKVTEDVKQEDENKYPGYPLRYDTKKYNDNVKKIQERINTIGYTLKVDGYFGKETEAAVKYIQERNNLAVDGIVGPKTWETLYSKDVTVETGEEGDY